MRTASVLVFDNCNASSVANFVDVLCTANQLWTAEHPKASPLFGVRVVSASGAPVTTSAGLRLDVDGALPRERSDVVYLPACHYVTEARLLREIDAIASEVRTWLVRQRRAGALLAAGCSGGFVLGRCGLLDGEIATTSWWLTAAFRREFPRAKLRDDELVTAAKGILCAGPVGAHGNLALKIVETLAGRDLALLCAKTLLIDPSRGSQRPYVVLQDHVQHRDELVIRAQTLMKRQLAREIGVADIARAVGASPRNLARRFQAACGVAPIEYLQRLRIEVAKNLLETTDLDLDAILGRIGYRDAATFRRLFKQRTSLSPREYRRKFAIGRAARRAG